MDKALRTRPCLVERELGSSVHVVYGVYIYIYIYSSPRNFITVLSFFVVFFHRAMANSNKIQGHDEDDHHCPFDYTDSKREEETIRHVGDEEEGHNDDDYIDSKKEEEHNEHDNHPFDYSFIIFARVVDAFLKYSYPEGYVGAGEERTPPQQYPQDCSHGHVVTKKPRSYLFSEKLSINKKRRVLSPASASNSHVNKLVKSWSSFGGKTKL